MLPFKYLRRIPSRFRWLRYWRHASIRIQAIDADFKGRSFEKAGSWSNDPAGLPNVSGILRYGDIPQWAAVLADRRVALRNVAQSGVTRRWLEEVFAKFGTEKNLRLQ